MKILIRFLLVGILMLVVSSAPAQKCKFSKKEIKRVTKELEGEIILNVTEPRVLFSKFSQGATAMFVKSREHYFFNMFFVREFGAKMEILPENPLFVRFDDNSEIRLDPFQGFERRHKLPLATFNIKPYYPVTEEQIQTFAFKKIVHVKIYFSSEKVGEGKFEEDELGAYFQFDVKSERYQSNCQVAASCILQH